jgi:hypothetical protein
LEGLYAMPLHDQAGGTAREDACRLEAEAHELLARAHGLLAQAARLRAEHSEEAGGADDLVPLSKSGLGARTRRRLEREGRLPVEKLGRQKFTRRSALVGLVGNGKANIPSPATTVLDPREAARADYAKISARRAADGNR